MEMGIIVSKINLTVEVVVERIVYIIRVIEVSIKKII